RVTGGAAGPSAIELPRRQRRDICQRSERRVSEGRGDRPGALQDGDVVDEATVLVGQNCCSQELAPVEHSSPEQDCPFVVAYLIGVFEIIDDAGSLGQEPEREVLAVEVRDRGRG